MSLGLWPPPIPHFLYVLPSTMHNIIPFCWYNMITIFCKIRWNTSFALDSQYLFLIILGKIGLWMVLLERWFSCVATHLTIIITKNRHVFCFHLELSPLIIYETMFFLPKDPLYFKVFYHFQFSTLPNNQSREMDLP
jgi:hypothetical protein